MSTYKPHPLSVVAFLLSLGVLFACLMLNKPEGSHQFERGQRFGFGAFVFSFIIAAIVEFILRRFKTE